MPQREREPPGRHGGGDAQAQRLADADAALHRLEVGGQPEAGHRGDAGQDRAESLGRAGLEGGAVARSLQRRRRNRYAASPASPSRPQAVAWSR